jgi:hypothetical protein
MLDFNENSKNTPISISSSGDNTIISTPTKGFIVIDNLNFVPSSPVNVTLKAGSRSLSGAYPLTANQGWTQDNTMGKSVGILRCLPGEAFVINLSGAVACAGFVDYRIIGE